MELVVGVFNRAQLSEGLTAVHRAGFGPQARVLDSARGPLREQLRQLGHRAAAEFGPDETDTVLVVIGAPGRSERATAMLRQAGARDILATDPPATPAAAFAPAAVAVSSPPPAEFHDPS